MNQRVIGLTLLVGLIAVPHAAAQPEPATAADLRFVAELRKRGDAALALEYLKRLQEHPPSPELAKEIPFEIAKTTLVLAAQQPDRAQKHARFQEARGEFEKFLAGDPNSPRAAEARMEIAHVALLQGKTQLGKALSENSTTEASTARKMLADAGKQMEAAAADIDAQLKKVPESDQARRRKLEADHLQAEFNLALNLYDQAQTYLDDGIAANRRRRLDALDKAKDAMEKIAGKDDNTFGWQAAAWMGRCFNELGSPNDARKSLNKLLGKQVTPANSAALGDARRLARYFLMELPKENPSTKDSVHVADTIKAARDWLKDYPRHLNTPEGYGVRYLLAEQLLIQADGRPNSATDVKQREYAESREILKTIENNENDFTDRARRLKIALIDRQNGFKVPLEQLKTLDDCFVRSQYEMGMTGKDLAALKEPKDTNDPEYAKYLKDRDAAIKNRRDAAIKALEAGLARPDAKNPKGQYTAEANNVRLALAFTYLQAARFKDAIQAGEALALDDSKPGQAPTAAAYAVQAHAEYLAARAQNVASKDELKADRDKFLAFAQIAKARWPDDLAGNLARHQIGLMHLREKQLAEGIKELFAVTPSYPEYVLVRYQISDVCRNAEKEKREPPKDAALPATWSEIGLKALADIPDSAFGSPEPAVNHYFLLSRIRIGQEYYAAKKYAEMEKIAQPLVARVDSVRVSADDAKDAQLRRDLKASLQEIVVSARYGLADAEYKEKSYAKVLELLDPVIIDINAGKLPQLKNNPRLADGVLSLALNSTVQLNKPDRTKVVLQAMAAASGDGDGSNAVLVQLLDLTRTQIDELKTDKDALAKAKERFESILAEVARAQKKPSAEFAYLLAKNYSGLDRHDKAAALLETVKELEKTGTKEKDEQNQRLYHSAQAALMHEIRLTGDKERAKKLLEDALGPQGKPGWGATNAEVQLEQVMTLEDDGKFAVAARLADQWAGKLRPKDEADVPRREMYLEFYYHTAYCYYKYGMATKAKGDAAKGDKAIKEAAQQLVQLEKTWKDFGSEASAKRIGELLASESELKAQYDALKKK
jgi:hypothetical protein